ncbi:alpha/beta fold hydrolase [Bauldia sp.]|uniref:alpha/beta fold hydrolase n=1 Tax=Bauldia sp. TaxID=2575872 RepID=UPI003BACE226
MRRVIGTISLLGAIALGANQSAAESVTLENGIDVAYDSQGSGEKTVILVHGYSFAKEIWSRAMPHLSDGWRLIAYDIRGFGDSTKPDDGYDYPTMANDLRLFMDALDVDEAVLIGHSMGGILIQDFATTYPERVSGLVLANVHARNRPPLGMNDDFQATIDAWGDAETNREIFQGFTPVFFKAENLRDGDLDELISMNVKSGTAALKQALETIFTTEAMSAETWEAIDMPVLIVASTNDVIPCGTEGWLLDSLPQSDIVVFKRVRHTPMWEKPEAFAEAVNGFLDTLN